MSEPTGPAAPGPGHDSWRGSDPEPGRDSPHDPERAPEVGRDPDPGREAHPTGSAPASAAVPGASVRRPLIERIGMAGIALVLAALFGGVAVAAFSGGEVFLAAMGAIGCLMTLWVGGLTLFRG